MKRRHHNGEFNPFEMANASVCVLTDSYNQPLPKKLVQIPIILGLKLVGQILSKGYKDCPNLIIYYKKLINWRVFGVTHGCGDFI